ncbi:MAG: hypothetical protein M1840_002021 [Geoglossum simile]|nr:MAG: hypothetical protein M1840_002021 [Geoglossum simile]
MTVFGLLGAWGFAGCTRARTIELLYPTRLSALTTPDFPSHRRGISFKYQSQAINFSEWLSLLTLAFAPLIAHILVGVARPVPLRGKIPWYERVCHYNPTSIFWRYFAITDRRFRAKEWTKFDLAATNAVFWDGYRWDGSVNILMEEKKRAIGFPEGGRVPWASGSMFHTFIISLQGAQAVYIAIAHARNDIITPGHPISYVFFPLAILGLLRIPAAPWLTDEYWYEKREGPEPQQASNSIEMGDIETDDLLPPEQAPPVDNTLISTQFYPQRSWRGIVVRTAFLGALLLLLATIIVSMSLGWGPDIKTSLSLLFTSIYYLSFLVCTLSFFLAGLLQKKDDTTIIPYIETPIYKAYTLALFLLSVGYIVVTALETRRTACGLYTTAHVEWGQDAAICKAYRAF